MTNTPPVPHPRPQGCTERWPSRLPFEIYHHRIVRMEVLPSMRAEIRTLIPPGSHWPSSPRRCLPSPMPR